MYGAGSGGFQLAVTGVKELANPIYNVTLHLNPTLIGLVLMFSRLFDAFTDPLMGKISDDTRSRFGRRRPYIFGGSFLVGIAFIVIWRVNPGMDEQGIFIYYLCAMLFFYLCATIQTVPYHTLGLEMTADYNERTVISGYKMGFSFTFLLAVPWVFRVAQADQFEDTMSGIRFLSYFIALAIVVGGVLPAIFVKERYYKLAARQSKVSFLTSAKDTFRNRAFLILTALILFAGVGAGTVNSLGFYIVNYYMYHGDLKAGSEMYAIISNTGSILSLLCVPLVTWLAGRWGKTRALAFLMSLGAIAAILKYVLYNQQYPWLAPFVYVFLSPSTTGIWVIAISMKADICDDDEWRHGMRREGMFGAVGNWVQKVAVAIAYFISGAILDLTGFDVVLAGDQDPGTIERMRILFSIVPLVCMLCAIYLVHRFPLTRERMAEIRAELEARREAV